MWYQHFDTAYLQYILCPLLYCLHVRILKHALHMANKVILNLYPVICYYLCKIAWEIYTHLSWHIGYNVARCPALPTLSLEIEEVMWHSHNSF